MVATEWILGINEADLVDVHAIRQQVFCEEQKISQAIERDGFDASAIHLLVSVDDKPAATGRLLVNADEYVIGRVAVLQKYRGKGLGDLAVRLLIRCAYNMGGETQTVHSQLQVREFYEKLGFSAQGEVYQEAGIAHITMLRHGDIFGSCEASSG